MLEESTGSLPNPRKTSSLRTWLQVIPKQKSKGHGGGEKELQDVFSNLSQQKCLWTTDIQQVESDVIDAKLSAKWSPSCLSH